MRASYTAVKSGDVHGLMAHSTCAGKIQRDQVLHQASHHVMTFRSLQSPVQGGLCFNSLSNNMVKTFSQDQAPHIEILRLQALHSAVVEGDQATVSSHCTAVVVRASAQAVAMAMRTVGTPCNRIRAPSCMVGHALD